MEKSETWGGYWLRRTPHYFKSSQVPTEPIHLSDFDLQQLDRRDVGVDGVIRLSINWPIFMYSKIGLENYSRNYSRDLFVLTILILLALASRIYGISDWHFVGDEFPTVHHAAERAKGLVNLAYYVLVVGSFELFGVSEWSARLPALILGVISIPVLYLTWRSVVGHNVALIGALLAIFSSWHLHYSQFSRFYMGVFLFGSLAYFLYYKAIRSDNLNYLCWGMVANLTAVLFHLTSVLIAASFVVFSVIVLLSKAATDSGYSKRIAIIFLAIAAGAGLIVTPYLWQVVIGWLSFDQFGGYGPAELVLQSTKYIQLPIVISALFGIVFLMRKDFLKGIFFAVGIGVPLLVLMTSSMVIMITGRYMFYVLPLIFLLSAFLCDQVRQSLLNLKYKIISSHAITIVIIVCMLPETVSHYVGRNSLDLREVIAFVEKSYEPGDRILYWVQGQEQGFNRYAKKDYVLEPRYGGFPHHYTVDWTQALKHYEDKQDRVWIILNAWRRPLANDFEAWLMANASLVWRKFETRYDQHVKGYEIWLMNGSLSNRGEVVEVETSDPEPSPKL